MQSTIISILIALIVILSSINIITPMKNVNAWHQGPRESLVPSGDYDFFIANGYPGNLSISDNNGMITGSVDGNRIIGFWDKVAHKIIFMRMGDPADPSTFQVYKGYSFQYAVRDPVRGIVCYEMLSGEFLTPAGAGGSPQRFEYGWFARTNIVCD